MEPNKVLKSDFLDILFEGRNKQYGAYTLRKEYPRRLLTAVIAAASLALLLILLSSFLKSDPTKKDAKKKDAKEMAQAKDDAPPPPPPPPPPVQKVDMLKYTPPKFVEKEKAEDPPKDTSETKASGTENQTGPKKKEFEEPEPGNVDTVPKEKPKPKDDPNKVYSVVEVNPRFDGDWSSFLQKAWRAPSDDDAVSGKLTVDFIVEKDGQVTDLKLSPNSEVKSQVYLKEAIRCLKLTQTKWKPGIQNGTEVRTFHSQVFSIIPPDE